MIKNNSTIVDLFSTQDLMKAWEKATGRDIAQALGETARIGANWAATVLDTQTAIKLIRDLGVNGRVILKVMNGKQYVIFKGYAGTRSILTGTRYFAANPKVVDMAIGRIGVNRAILSGARLTIFLVVPLNIVNHLLKDQQTLSQLVGKTATDLIKVGTASAVASLAASATATVTSLAAGPIIVAIAVGIAAAYTLDKLDQKFGLTETLIKAIDDTYDSTIGEFGRQWNQAERRLKWQIMNGVPVGKGVFY